ncbi:MAG: HIT family protein [Clostridiales bacterium]|nr:HIT family protein [Clostridiales bacterium]
MENNCIFCKIIKGEVPSYKIYENEYVYAFLDIAKDSVGHTLVIPKEHYVNSLDCDMEYYMRVQEAVKYISEHYVNNCGYTGVNIINASGVDAQQSVFHYHVHIIPRRAEDGLDIWPLKEKYDIDLAKIAEKLKI